jgi:hypothetical protein
MTKRNPRFSVYFIFCLSAMSAIQSAGCGSLKCPEGTVRVGDFCKRVDPDTGINNDIIITVDTEDPRDSSEGDVPDDVRVDVTGDTNGDVVVDAGDATLIEDVGDVSQYPAGYVGKACNTPAACRSDGWPDGKCLSWPKGFCAMPGCDEDLVCPDNTVCMNLAAGSTGAVCTLSCVDDSDCREIKDALGNGYACKRIADPNGVYKSICFMEKVDPMHVGGPCAAHEACADGMGCLPNFDGGYCAVLNCDEANGCPAGTECVRLQGRGVCLESCATSEDCAESRECTVADVDCVGQVQLSRACVEMKNFITLDKTKVCGSGTVGKSVGEQCLNETECKSGKCNVSYTGTCSDFDVTNRRCLLDSDCSITKAICRQSSADTYGFCSGSCSRTVNSCTEQSVCVETLVNDVLTGMCVPGCTPTNPEDPFSESDCWEEAGLRCMWGDTLFQPNVRSCVRIDEGDPGMSCRRDTDCYSGQCIGKTATDDGTCTMACIDGSKCPFPTICEDVDSAKLCMKRCQATPDCPGTMYCKVGTSGDYCSAP